MARDGSGLWKRGNSWYISIWHDGQRYIERLGPISKTLAKEIVAKRRTELAEGKLKPKARDPLFAAFIDSYLRDISINKAPLTHERDKSLAANLKGAFGEKRLSQITQVDIERYKRDRRDKVSPASINRELALLSNAFNVAKLPNPVKGVKRFPESGRIIALDHDEETRLFQVINEHYPELEPLFRILIGAGYRRGEVLSLVNDKEMINFEQGYIRIPRMIRKGKKKEVVTPLNKSLTEALQKAIKISGAKKGEKIFPYSGDGIAKRWQRIRRLAGLANIRTHDLRHTFGTRAGQAAHDDPYAVQELMGHTDFRTTQKYIHVNETRKKAIMERMEANVNNNATSGRVISLKPATSR